MNIEIDLGKVIDSIGKIKIPYLTLFFAFISSFALWFLTLHHFSTQYWHLHGWIISLITIYALTISWLIIAMVSVPKQLVLYLLIMGENSLTHIDSLLQQRAVINLYVFANTLFLHGFVLYISYIFSWSLFIIISILFWSAILIYFFVDILLKARYQRMMKNKH